MTVEKVQKLIKSAEAVFSFSASLTPSNFAEQKQKFLATSDQNPIFIYPDVDRKNIQFQIEQLARVEFSPTSFPETILARKVQELILQGKLLLARGTSSITELSQELFQGTFSPEYIQQAEHDANMHAPNGELENLTGEETAVRLQEYLQKEYGAMDWTTEVVPPGDFYVRVKAGQKKILVNGEINWDFSSLDTLIAHEIDGHVLRYLNAQRQPEPFLRTSTPFYIKTEEGVASFLGDFCAEKGTTALKHHAVKYLGGLIAMKESFVQTYEFFLAHGFTPPLAFQRTFRLKRGLEDTFVPGCFTKEALYYEGMLEVKKYLDDGGDPYRLFAGKLGLNDLSEVSIPEGTQLPSRLSHYLSV